MARKRTKNITIYVHMYVYEYLLFMYVSTLYEMLLYNYNIIFSTCIKIRVGIVVNVCITDV